jgi:hypothetical protein
MPDKKMPGAIRLLSSCFFALLLMSCASTDNRYPGSNYQSAVDDDSGNYKYDAWRLRQDEGLDAINLLLDESDVLIKNNAYNAATDKLERVLRIKPDYAPAWSRLSWLALQTNSASSSIQMAKRSNSFAYSDPELQLLNWTFIRSASQMLQDKDTYNEASQRIESLKAF